MHPDTYVASVCYGADPEQAIRALQEADQHSGPSIVIAYVPCNEHQPKGGFDGAIAIDRMKLAVQSGYWSLYRRRPGQPIKFDSAGPKEPGTLETFLDSEGRFASLNRSDPELSSRLRESLKRQISMRDDLLKAASSALSKK